MARSKRSFICRCRSIYNISTTLFAKSSVSRDFCNSAKSAIDRLQIFYLSGFGLAFHRSQVLDIYGTSLATSGSLPTSKAEKT
jgi:hypothetical protein